MPIRNRKPTLRKLSFDSLESRQLLSHPTPLQHRHSDDADRGEGDDDQKASRHALVGSDNNAGASDSQNVIPRSKANRQKAKYHSASVGGNPAAAPVESIDEPNTIAVAIESHSDTVRASMGKSSGRWYFEVIVDRLGDGILDAVGVAPKSLNLELMPGLDDVGCGFRSDGTIFCNQGQERIGFSDYAAGDVIGMAVDMDRGRAFFSMNGEWLDGVVPGTRGAKGLNMGLAGELEGGEQEARGERQSRAFPAVNISTSDSLTANFGGTPFRYTPPNGFRSGWYSQRHGQRAFATWNPDDRQANVSLSNGNLTAQTAFLPPASIGSARWNPADRQENIRLSNEDLTVQTVFPDGTHSDNDSIRATYGHATGKWYFEINVEKRSSSGYNAIGTATKMLWLEITPGADDYGCGYQANGYVQCNLRAITANFDAYAHGDVIGVAVDLNNNLAYFSKNGQWQGGANPESMTGGLVMGLSSEFLEFYPAVNISTGDKYTASFEATRLQYQAPGGFNPGW